MAYLGRTPAIGRYAKLDDIASSFNGSTTVFNLTSGGDAQVVQTETQLIVSLGGVIQEPQTDYTVSGSQITFTTAPLSGDDYFSILLGDTFNVGVPSDNTLQNRHVKSDAAIAMSKTALVGGTGLTLSTNTLNVDAAQTQITSLGTLTALQVDNININGNAITSTAGTDLTISPLSGQQIVLDGTIVVDAGVVTGATSITSSAFVGALTGNASGTAATVTTAAQPAITSLGTLTTLTVDNIIINGTNIGHTSDTDAIAIASNGVVTMNQIPVFSAGLNVSGGTIAGTLSTAAQGNITSLGTIAAFRSTGIDDNADALAMTIDSSENVGVGTTTMNGKFNSVPKATFSAAGTTWAEAALSTAGAFGGGLSMIDGSAGYILSVQDSGATFTIRQGTVGSNPAERIRINSAGNVGIGTAVPARPLVVASSAAMKLSTAKGALFNDTANDGGVIIGSDFAIGSIQATNAAGTSAKNLMLQKEGGLVGIGKTPTNKSLELYAASNTALRIQNSTTGTGGSDGFLIEQNGADSLLVNYEAGNMKFSTSGTTRMTIDSSGRITAPYQPAGFASYSGSDLTSGAVPLNSSGLQRGSLTIGSTSRFTVPVVGWYVVGYHHLATGNATQIQIRKNGSAVGGGSLTQAHASSAHNNFSAQVIMSLAASDYIEFFVTNGTLHGNASYNGMYIYFLG